MIYQAILFDMDGVLIDTHQSVTTFWLDIAAMYDRHLTEADFNRHIYGCPAGYTLDILFPGLTGAERQAVFDKLIGYEANLRYTPLKGVLPLLQALHHYGLPTALVTSGDRHKVRQVSQQLELGDLFATQVTVEDIEQGKPHPECYLLAAQRLQVSPERCLVFEDSVSGVTAAIAAGALCIGIRSAYAEALLEVGVRRVIPDFSEVGLRRGEKDSNHLDLRIGADYKLLLTTER